MLLGSTFEVARSMEAKCHLHRLHSYIDYIVLLGSTFEVTRSIEAKCHFIPENWQEKDNEMILWNRNIFNSIHFSIID